MASHQLRERFTREVPARVPPSRRLAHADELADQWIDRHPAQFRANTTAIARRLRSELAYAGDNGREYVYLNDRWSHRDRAEPRGRARPPEHAPGRCFQELPGFRLVFRSPEATVKIFAHVPTESPAGGRP
jgi:hypothetical protein